MSEQPSQREESDFLSRSDSAQNRPRTHWYNPAIPLDTAPPPNGKRGRARERIRRRQEGRREENRRVSHDFRKVKSTSNRMWGNLALAVVGIFGIITMIVFSAARGSTNTSPTLTPPNAIANNGSGIEATQVTINIQPWNGKERFTVLVIGIDKRPGEKGTGFRADTLIVVSIDPKTNKIGMLSIPRDIYVATPGRDELSKINTMYITGELKQPGYGPRLMAETVQYNFGIPIDSYVVVSFDTVIKLVDAVGGVEIQVAETIDDPEYPDMYNGYEPLYIPAGLIQMNGELALKYARTRHHGNDDYDRTRRQQQVILALRNKALSVLPELIGKAPSLWEQVQQGLITQMTFDQMLGLGWYLKDVPTENIVRGTVDSNYLQAILYNGATVLTTNRVKIGELMVEVFGEDYPR